MEKVAIAIIKKWLRKGNLARCMRDILPNSKLTLKEREEVAKIAHDVVRWKRWYGYLMDFYGLEKNAENYVKMASRKIKLNEKEAEKKLDKEKYIAIRYSFSDFLANQLKGKEDFVFHLNKEARTTLCINLNRIEMEDAIKMLKDEKMEGKPSKNVETAVFTDSRARYSKLVKNGFAHVQDESSQLVAKITALHGKKLLDYCAGNGGKSLAMASITKNKADIYAYDINRERLKTLERRAYLYGAKINILKNEEDFDAVLVDAPCTGVGAARRNPEAKYVEGVGEYPKKQEDIIKNAWKFVKKNGYLIYSICSFLPEETVAIEKIDGIAVDLNMHGLIKYENGYITWLPEGDILFIGVRKKSD